MTPDIREFYRVLELSPGASLEEIKGAYRRLMNQWHPDRFKPGSVMQTTAEDMTKDLNEAYHQLCRKKRYLEFRRARPSRPVCDAEVPPPRGPWTPPVHQARKTYAQAAKDSNPPPPPPAPPPPRRKPFRPPEPRPTAEKETTARSAPPAAEVSSAKPARSRRLRAGRWAAAILGLAIAAFFTRWVMKKQATAPVVERFTPSARTTTTRVASSARASAPAAPAISPARTNEITEPSVAVRVVDPAPKFARSEWPNMPSLSAAMKSPSVSVPSVTGVETRTESHRWRAFGAARVDSTSAVNEALSSLDTFAAGDTPARVLALQGVPDEANERVFRYGSSVIYFSGGRVVAWRDGWPRLRTFALPRFVFGGLATFGVGSSRNEVVRVQGTPTAVGESVYFYGNSVVFFDREWVSSWREIDEPLRARAWPSPPASLLAARTD